MKFYLVHSTDNQPASYERTQDDAKRAAKMRGVPFSMVDVPTEKDGLRDFLNAFQGNLWAAQKDVAQPAAEPKPAPVACINPAVGKARTADDIVAFILDEAPVYQCENIFAALGTRFGELANGQRNA
jgi:hypothetical protein